MFERYLFGGLTATDKPDAEIPRSYQRLHRRHGTEFTDFTFEDVLDRLQDNYHIEWRDLFYRESDKSSPEYGHDFEVSHFQALVNPRWVGLPESDIPGDREDAVWHIPTKKYTRVPHEETFTPLYEAIRRKGAETDVFGSTRLRREGGEVHMDVFFENAGLDGLDTSDEITLGISTGHDYFGNTRLYVDVVAYHSTGDGVGQVMRYLVDPKRRKHTGDAGEDVIEWYEDAVDRLERVSDTLYNIVADAMHYEVPLGDLPCSIPGFYEHLGLPNNSPSVLAEPAGKRAVKTAVGPYTAWHLYKAGMWAVEHEYDSRDTSSFKTHVNTVNTLLFNPSLAEKQVLKSVESDLMDRPDEEASIWDFVDRDDVDSTLDSIRTRAKSISDGVEEFESTRERLETLLQDEGVDESVPDDEMDELETVEADD